MVTGENVSVKIFKRILFLTFLLKLLLSYFFPLTGDEAYFITTSKQIHLGYYEHPPMIWWLLYLFSFGGRYLHHYFFYRLFAVFTTTFLGYLILKELKNYDFEKGVLISTLFFLSPIHLFNIFITNDIPVLFFLFLSGYFFYKGIKSEKIIYFILSGIFGGFAFLSKYFAVLYFLSAFIFILIRREKRFIKFFLVFFISSLPLLSINLYWNYTHNWVNFLFNLVYRKKVDYLNLKNILSFFLSLFLLLTPFPFFILLKQGFFIKKIKGHEEKFFLICFLIPITFYFSLSFFRKVGLHWYLPFIPFSFLLLHNARKEEIQKSVKTSLFFSVFIILIVISLVFLPSETFKRHKKYPQLIMFKKPYSICRKLSEIGNGFVYATTGYTEAAIMGYYCKKNFVVLKSLSASGRHYDLYFDYRDIDKKNILIFSLNKLKIEEFIPFFKNVKSQTISVNGANFYLIIGDEFNFEKYREIFLKEVYQKYYKIPFFLPTKGNFFKEKYGF